MSIALNIQLKPSRMLPRLLAGMLILSNAALILALSMSALPLSLQIFLAATALMCGARAFHTHQKKNKSAQIHISGSGAIILRMTGASGEIGRGLRVRLDTRSTMWSKVLFLYLRAEDGRMYSLLILPDSLDVESFRALFVALQWINRRGGTSRRAEK
ncbi:MAG: hypothetical protein HYZ65_06925 [Burkholderiales bacterium]|nr:hypothetical protein [Burkholderiales bacterium]